MLEKIIGFFVKNHLFTNFFYLVVLFGGIYFWNVTNKEELPNIEFDFLRVSVTYPGGSPEDVEQFVTRAIEDSLKGVTGIHAIRSTSYDSFSTIFIELDGGIEDKKEAINELKNTILNVDLPEEAKNLRIRQFKTAQKAILDVALVDLKSHLLDDESRTRLQKYSLALENQMLSLNEISDVGRSGYLKEEVRINLIPEKLKRYDTSAYGVVTKLKNYHLRQPLGSLKDQKESPIIVSPADYSIERLADFTLRGSYQQPEIKLKQVAEIERVFVREKSITKVNGKEAIVLRVTKSSDAGIIEAVDRVKQIVEFFRVHHLKDSSIKVITLDDESKDVRNRLTLISYNGLIGFGFILILLFVFMDFRSGFWVAMGIPFTFCFTMIVIYHLGYTINNITLAGVIIVMGMIVDDAIVVAENIVRLRDGGASLMKAVIDGTTNMFLPVTASTLTTCVAFMPLIMMEGRFAKLIIFIPVIVIVMLIASLLESFFILPGHMNFSLPRWSKICLTLGLWYVWKAYSRQELGDQKQVQVKTKKHWFFKLESLYAVRLEQALGFRYIIMIGFLAALGWAFYHLKEEMNFVMFPNEEASQIMVTAMAPEGSKSRETARWSQKIEAVLEPYLNREVIGYTTRIATGGRGRVAEENRIYIIVEMVSLEKRDKSLNQLIEEWNQQFSLLKELKVNIRKQRFGQSGGSSIEIAVLDNDSQRRKLLVDELYQMMNQDTDLYNVEVGKVLQKEGFQFRVKKNFAELLGVGQSMIVSTLRTILSGNVVEKIQKGDEEIDLLVTVRDHQKNKVDQLLDMMVEGKNQVKHPIGRFVEVEKVTIPHSVERESHKRITRLYADHEDLKKTEPKKQFKKAEGQTKQKTDRKSSSVSKQKNYPRPQEGTKASLTPLQIAERYEREIFPQLLSKYPTARIYFDGEIRESRESKHEFQIAIWVVVILIYMILALLFQSIFKPFLIIMIIPFGIAGVMVAYYLHGIQVYGFFALLGILGLSGVVVNDTIVMLAKLDGMKSHFKRSNLKPLIAKVAQTRVKSVLMTTFTTIAGLFPTAYGIAGYDSLLAEMMFAMGWGLLFATLITLLLAPILYHFLMEGYFFFQRIGWVETTPDSQ